MDNVQADKADKAFKALMKDTLNSVNKENNFLSTVEYMIGAKDVKEAILITIDKEETLKYNYSGLNPTKSIRLLEIAKNDIIFNSYEPKAQEDEDEGDL